MQSGETIRISFGAVQPMTFHEFENGKMISYCYSIKRDRHGMEKSRTEPTRLGSLGYDDGSDFTEDEYNHYKCGTPRIGH